MIFTFSEESSFGLDSTSQDYVLDIVSEDVIENVKLTPQGYKIGLEILVKGNCQKVKEVPFVFNNRVNGKSKMSFRIQMEYLVQIGHLYSYRLKKTMLNRRN